MAGRTLRWFVEDVWGHFGDDHHGHGAPLFPSERKNTDGSATRISGEALRANLPRQPPGTCRTGRTSSPQVLRHFCAASRLPWRHGPDRYPTGPRTHLGLPPRCSTSMYCIHVVFIM